MSGAVPPEVVIVVLYVVPTTPDGGLPVIAGSGLTVMLTVFPFCVPATVAWRVNFICPVSPGGAVYVMGSPEVLESVPHAVPEQEPPLRLHVKGRLPATVALTRMLCPASSVIDDAESAVIPAAG